MATRSKREISYKGTVVSSYAELIDLSSRSAPAAPRTSSCPRTYKTWKSGLYPIEILTDSDEDGYCKVHYIGWPRKFDERIKQDAIESIVEPPEPWLKVLKILIKEALKPGPTDSKINIRIPVDEKDFGLLKDVGIEHRITRSKTVYKLRMRQDLERLLGVGWDYRVFNPQGDNFYISTETVRFWMNKRSDLADFLVFPDHVEENFLDRGYQMTFTFVKVSGNRNLFKTLLNADVL